MKNLYVSLFLLGSVAVSGFSQGSCPAPNMNDFNLVTLINSGPLVENQSLDGPIHMAVAPDGRIFVAKMRTGDIVMRATNGNTSTIGSVPTYFNNESGLLGIAVPPDFGTNNNWLYVYTAGNSANNRTREIVRYTVTGNSLTNRKVILSFSTMPADDGVFHAGGGMAFSDDGVLIVGVGDDTNPWFVTSAPYANCTHGGWSATQTNDVGCDAQRTAGNTNDLRGGIIRIKPITFPDTQSPNSGIGNTYDIPPGNLRDVITGLPNWGNQDINDVRPEVFAKGARNPYKVGLDSRSGWIFWGEVGPDANAVDLNTPGAGYEGQEEWNLTARAGYFGWPYSNGNRTYNGYNANAPVNNSPNNTGITNLPPVTFPQVWYSAAGNMPTPHNAFRPGGAETAMTGPMYRYDPNLNSSVKFPPYYEGKIFFFEWGMRYIRTIEMNSDATFNTSQAFNPGALPTASYIDLQFGPDGALYLLRFSSNGNSGLGTTAVYRLEYTGNLNNNTTCFQPFTATVLGPDAVVPIMERPSRRTLSPAMADGFIKLPAGYKTIEIYDTAGRKVWSHSRSDYNEGVDIKLPGNLATGVWHAKFLR